MVCRVYFARLLETTIKKEEKERKIKAKYVLCVIEHSWVFVYLLTINYVVLLFLSIFLQSLKTLSFSSYRAACLFLMNTITIHSIYSVQSVYIGVMWEVRLSKSESNNILYACPFIAQIICSDWYTLHTAEIAVPCHRKVNWATTKNRSYHSNAKSCTK